MLSIYDEFRFSLERVHNNFYLSFLALNYINQRPFLSDIQLEVAILNNILKKDDINSIDEDSKREYSNSIRRHFLNDMVIAYERYATLMYVSHLNGRARKDPSLENKSIYSSNFEQLLAEIKTDDFLFLKNLKSLRNCIIHYNGKYSVKNKLDYQFGFDVYNSNGNIGKDLTIGFKSLQYIHQMLLNVVGRINRLYYLKYPIL
jgi:hypothetical protein